MQVYKLFLKVLKSQISQVILYIGIFATIAGLVSAAHSSKGDSDFKLSSNKVTIVDNDKTQVSKAIVNHISKNNEIVDILAYDKETIQDELYNRNTTCVIMIPDGFEENFIKGNINEALEFYTIPGTIASDIIEQEVDSYVKIIQTYSAGGIEIEDAIKNANSTSEKQADVDMIGKKDNGESPMSYFFTYIAYVFIGIAVVSIAPILLVFNKDEIRSRMACSSYKLSRITSEIILGIITLGAVICIVFTGMGVVMVGSDVVTTSKGLLYILNMAVYMVVALGLAFLAGQIARNQTIISMIANIVGLGFCFLGGVFVPIELMGEGVIKVAHFLPSYWYIMSGKFINNMNTGDNLIQLFEYMGVQLIFAAALFTAGAVVIKVKRS